MSARVAKAKVDKKKARKARKALLGFLNRLRAGCKLFTKVDEWFSKMNDLQEILDEYVQELPPACLAGLEQAQRLVDSTRAGIGKSCKILETELESTLRCLPKGAGSAPGAIGALVAVAAIVGAAVIYLNQTAVPVVIRNEGCGTLSIPLEMPVSIPGVELPKEPIPSGGEATARVPRMTVTVDATDRNDVKISVLGVNVPVQLGRGYTSIKLDGVEILGKRSLLSVGGRKAHELIISCR